MLLKQKPEEQQYTRKEENIQYGKILNLITDSKWPMILL